MTILTRADLNLSTAMTAFNTAGIDIRADFHTLTWAQVVVVLESAREAGYRRPVKANGSKARYWFEALQRAYIRSRI